MAQDKQTKRALKAAYKAVDRTKFREHMPLSARQLNDLLDFLEDTLSKEPWDSTYWLTSAWANGHSVAAAEVKARLQTRGAYCDCEVIMNADPEEIFL